MNIARLFGIHPRADVTALSPRVMPPARADIVAIDEILGLDAVYRAIAYLQTLAGQLKIDTWRGDHPTDSPLVAHPDPWRTQRQWITETVAALALHGNAFWRVDRDDKGAVLALINIDPARVIVTIDAGQVTHYAVDGRAVDRRDIAHLRYLSIPGKPLGLGPIQAAYQGLTGLAHVQRYADNLFTRGGTPAGVLSTDQPLTRDAADAAATEWMEKQNAGKTAVLGQGLTYQPIGVKPSELQWLDSQKWGVSRVARLFGIPPAKLASAIEGGSMTYNNLETASLDMLRDTLMGYISPIEDQLTALLPRGQSARFNLNAVLRPDTKTRYEAHALAIQTGFLTVDEVRDIEGLPPLATTPTPADTPESETVS